MTPPMADRGLKIHERGSVIVGLERKRSISLASAFEFDR